MVRSCEDVPHAFVAVKTISFTPSGKFKVEVKLLLDRLKLLTGVPATVKLMPCVFGMFKTVA